MPLTQNEQDFALARLVNQNHRAEGPTLPPRAIGGIRVPSVSNLKIIKTSNYWGGTEFTLTWLEPDEVIDQVDSYSIYVTGLFETNNQPIGVWGGRRSPAVVRVSTDSLRRVVFFCQTVLKSGFANEIATCPSVSAIATGTSITPSDLVSGSGNLTTANRIVLVNSAGTVKQLGSLGTTTTVLHGNAGGAPTFGAVSLTADVTGTLPVANGGTNKTSWTAGSVAFAGAGGTALAEDNTNLFFDDTNNRLGIGTAAPGCRLHVQEATPGNEVLRLSSTATNDDPTESVFQNRVATTDATVTALHTVTIPASTTVALEAVVVARRTGGAAGTAEDGARYILSAVYKNVAGTATLIGAVTKTADADQAGWDANLTISTNTVVVEVTGAANNNVTWHLTLRRYQVST